MALNNLFRFNPRLNPLIFLFFIFSVGMAVSLKLDINFWLWCYFVYFLSFALGVCMCLHRIACHDSAQIPKLILYPFSLLGSLAHVGTPMEWFLGHSLHHQYSDQVSDPILPTLKGLNHLMGIYQPVSTKDTTRLLLSGKDFFLMKDKYLLSLSKYFYLYFIGTYFLIYFLLGWQSLLIFSIGNIGALVGTSFLTYWSHLKILGYRRFSLPDQSINLLFMFPLFFGEELHNNHHGKPKMMSNSHRWWELDLIGFMMKLCKRTGTVKDV
jgi:sn-2 palmitoyl-lipid 9-desaturase